MQAMFDKKTTLKTKDLATRTSLKYGCELGGGGGGESRRVTVPAPLVAPVT